MIAKKTFIKIGVILLALGLLVAFLPVNLFDSWDFRNNLWGPAHLLVTGRSPYIIKQLFPLTNAVWMPPIIGLLFSLGWLDFTLAARAWLVANLAALGLLIYIFLRGIKPSLLKFSVTLALVFTFAPFILNLMLGQISILIALFLVLATLNSDSSLLAGLFLALALTKPQLCFLAVPGILFGSYQRKKITGLMRLGGAAAAWVAIFCLPFFAAFPGWIPDFLAALKDNANWAQPSLFFFLANHFGSGPGLIAWGLAAVVIFGVNLWIWKKCPPGEAVAWSLALTCLVTPYIWSWDFVLLLPCLFCLLGRPFNRLTTGILVTGFACGSALTWMMRWNTQVSDQIFFWLPPFFLGVYLLAAFIQHRNLPRT